MVEIIPCRFSAQYREYRYFIPHNDGEMDFAQMQRAASAFLGQHDFRNYCKVDAEHIKHCIRCILDFRIVEYPGFSIDGKRIAQVHIRGSAFLWHQVSFLPISASSSCSSWISSLYDRMALCLLDVASSFWEFIRFF